MRIALGIIGLVAGLIVFGQSFMLGSLAGIAASAPASETAGSGAVMGLLLIIAGAFGFALPLVSLPLFAFAG